MRCGPSRRGTASHPTALFNPTGPCQQLGDDLRLITCLISLLLLVACERGSARAEPAKLAVAAAASLKQPLTELIAAYVKRHPGVQVEPTYGASGTLFAQISQKAPFDVFLSADVEYPQKLIQSGAAVNESVSVFAIGRLSLWVSRESGLKVASLDDLKGSGVKRIAIANPRTAPYGRAAESALRNAGVLDAVRERLAIGESVEQAVGFVKSGAAEVAILPRSVAARPPLSDLGTSVEIPDEGFDSILHGAVVVSHAAAPKEARAFIDFVMSPEGQAVLKQYGLSMTGQ